jgi:glycosyltransferase involved in cell wall biosynthesis
MTLVPSGDVTALARAIERLMSDPAELERQGEAARRTAGEHFSWDRNADETLALYRELTGTRIGSAG